MSNLKNTSTENNRTEVSQNYASIAYVPELTEKLSKSCKYFTPNVQLAMRPVNKTNKFFANLKPRLDKKQKSDVVYKIQCKQCNAVYIGETTQKLGTRAKQHEYDCKKKLNSTTTNNLSALAKHARNNKHEFDFENVQILKTERNKFKLQIHEVKQIVKHEKTACNDKKDKKDYVNTYCNLIVPI